jgi:hypothetical protein
LDDPVSHKELLDDITGFCMLMQQIGLISRDTDESASYPLHYYEIGGLTISLAVPDSLVPKDFDAFATKDTGFADLAVRLHHVPAHTYPRGEMLLHSQELILCENEYGYRFFFQQNMALLEAILSKDGSCADLYYRAAAAESFPEELFHAIRFFYLYLAQMRGRFAIHSSSILYCGKAWLFSGSSGTGKSTHTKLWTDLLSAKLLNGDLNLVALENGQPVVYGIPWCGTSGVCTTKQYPLGGIILLRKADHDHFEPLHSDESQLCISQRMISPAWTKEQLLANLDFSAQLVPHIFCGRLYCTISDSAVMTVKEQIDHYLGEKNL